MKQFAVIGAGTLGKRVLEELVRVDCEIILLDKDDEVIEQFKNDVTVAYVANAINRNIVKQLIPSDIDAAVVDLGTTMEASVLVTQYLKQLGIPKIIVKAETEEHGEILNIVGAHYVVFPNLEAALRITPLLISDLIFQYLSISSTLVLAEVAVPVAWVGQKVERLKETGITLVGWRRTPEADYETLNLEESFTGVERLLVSGHPNSISTLTQDSEGHRRAGLKEIFFRLFGQAQKES